MTLRITSTCLRSVPGLVLAILAAAGSARADDRPVTPVTAAAASDQTDRLIEQLGAASFEIRQDAVRQLKEMGLPALQPLRGAAAHPNLEVAARARRLLVDVERLDHERRLALFLKDPNAAPDDLLPGLKRYRELVGREPPTAALFAEMQRAEPLLFRAADSSVKALESVYEVRTVELNFEYNMLQNRSRSAEKVCSLLFVGADPDVMENDQSANFLYGFVHWNEFRIAMTSGTTGPAVKKLVGAWIRKGGGMMAQQKLMLGLQFDLPECLPPAVELCKAKAPGGQAQFAVLAVARFGNPEEHVPLLEGMLGDKTELSRMANNNRTTSTSEMRDVVLAALLHLTKQEPRDYGFKALQKHPQWVYSPNTASFEKGEEREAALKKWQDWRAQLAKAGEANKPAAP